jgi:hypothetical protein
MNKRRRKCSLFKKKIYILAQVDVNKEISVALATRRGTVPSTMNAIVKNKKDAEKCHAQCGSVWLKEQRETVTISGTGEFVHHRV